jgi:small nuclear ribonucleoprotein (snRNP)-like protein
MGKRLVRLFQKDLLANIPRMIDRRLDIVMQNNTTIHGTLLSFTGNEIIIKDFISRKHKVNPAEIAEIIWDEEAPY